MDLHSVFVLFDIELGILILKKKRQHRTFLIFGKVHRLLFELLVAEHPVLAPFRESLLLARGTEMLEPGNTLVNNDVVALYPPFSGG